MDQNFFPAGPKLVLHERAPTLEEGRVLRRRIAFYESLLGASRPHNVKGECQIAKSKNKICCNPECDGVWGTGCWCCHSTSFALAATVEQIEMHLLEFVETSPSLSLDLLEAADRVVEAAQCCVSDPGRFHSALMEYARAKRARR